MKCNMENLNWRCGDLRNTKREMKKSTSRRRSSRCRQKHASSLEVLGLAQSNGTREKAKSQWTGANRVDTLTVQAMNRAVIYKWLFQYTETHRNSSRLTEKFSPEDSVQRMSTSSWFNPSISMSYSSNVYNWPTKNSIFKIRTHDCQQHTGSWPPRFVCFLSNLFYQTNKF